MEFECFEHGRRSVQRRSYWLVPKPMNNSVLAGLQPDL